MNWGILDFKAIKGKMVMIGVLVITIIIIVIATVVSCSSKKNLIRDDSVLVENIVEGETQIQIRPQEKDTHLNQDRSKLTGLWVDSATVNNSPVAVMYSNISDAMPQSSLGYADVVFESLVEGGITRLCGVFENRTTLKKIGPVRSCRTYYVLFAKEFEATYVHFGYSDYAEVYLQNKIMHSLDGMVYCNFYRTTDRVAPHNAYTSWSGIMDSVASKGYPTVYPDNYQQPFTYNNDDTKEITIASGQKCLEFYPGYVYNKPYFTYNQKDKHYYRFQFGDLQIDDQTGEQLKYKNILVKYVTGTYWPNGTPNYTVTGTGKGLYITNGKAVDVTWKNNSEFGPTKYYDEDGKEIILNQGKTWICQVEATSDNLVKVLDSLQK